MPVPTPKEYEAGWPLKSSMSLDSDIEKSLKSEEIVVPPEGGLAAWSFVAGAFVMEAVCWGFPNAFGVFATYYQKQLQFEGQEVINSIGTMGTGVSAVLGPFLIYFGAKYPAQRSNTMRLGAIICVLSMVGAAYANTAVLLVLTQGVGWGIGSAMTLTPTLTLLVEWFDVRKGLAFGVMFGGSGVTGASLPFIFGTLLDRYGSKVVLLGWAAATLCTILPAAIFLRGNFPLEQLASVQGIQWKLTRTPLFILLGIVVFLQGAVIYLPGSFLPAFGLDAGLGPWQQALLLSGLNIATIPGQALFGWLADIRGAYFPLLLGSILSSASVLLLWGFARTFAVLITFAIVYGVVSGGVTTVRARFATVVTEGCVDPSQEATIYGLIRFLAGFGGIVGGLAGSKFSPDVVEPFGSGYAGGLWTRLIGIIGIVFLVTSLGYCGKFLRRPQDILNGEKHRNISIGWPQDMSKLSQSVFEEDESRFEIWREGWKKTRLNMLRPVSAVFKTAL